VPRARRASACTPFIHAPRAPSTRTSPRQVARLPGYLSALTSVIDNAGLPKGIRLAAALSLKRATMDWSEDSPEVQAENRAEFGRPDLYSEEEKSGVRNSLVRLAVGLSDRPLINALADSLRLIARQDFPTAWPGLLPSLLTPLAGRSGVGACITALHLSHALLKQYEMKSWDEASQGRGPGDIASSALLPALAVMGTSLAAGEPSAEAGTAMSLVLKCYYRAMHLAFPNYAATRTPASVQAWVSLCLAVMAKPAPQVADPEARADSPWWHVKKWAMTVLARFAEAWADPSDYRRLGKGKGAVEAKASAKLLRDSLVPGEILPAVLSILKASVEESGWASPRVVHASLTLISSGLQSKACSQLLTPLLPWLAGVALPSVLTLTAVDVALFEEDPAGWLDGEEDFVGSWYDPRRTADALLKDMMERKAHRTLVQPVLEAFIGRAFAGGALPAKEVALRLLALLSRTWRYSKAHRRQLSATLAAHVTPDMSPPAPPILRIRAVRTWSSFMASDAIDGPSKAHVAGVLLAALNDGHEGVRMSAALALADAVKLSDDVRAAVRPHLSALLTGLFAQLDGLGHETLVDLVDSLVETYIDEAPDMAGPLAQRLSSLFLPLFASVEDGTAEDEDTASMMAGTVLETVCKVMDSLGEEGAVERRATAITHVLPEVWRLLDVTLPPVGAAAAALGRKDGAAQTAFQDFLDISTSLFTLAIRALGADVCTCEPAWALLTRLCALIGGECVAWIEDACAPIDAMLDFGRARFAAAGSSAPGDPIDSLLGMLSAVEAPNGGEDSDRVLGTRLAVSSLWHVWRTPGGARLAASLVPLYATGLTSSRTSSALSACSGVLCMSLLVWPAATVQALGACPGGALAVLPQVLARVEASTRLMDLKVSALGLAELLRACTTPGAEGSALAASLAPLLPSLLERAVGAAAGEDRARLDAAAKKALEAAEALEDEDAANSEAGEEEEDGEDEEIEDDGEEGGGEGEGDGEGEDEYDWDDDEEEEKRNDATPCDHVSTHLLIAEVVAALGRMPGAQDLQARVAPESMRQLSALLAKAADERAAGGVLAALGPAPVAP